MIFQYNQNISFSYVDEHGDVTPGSYIDLFQDAADLHTQAVVSPTYQKESHRVWILSYWHILFDRPCRFHDNVKIATWSAGTKGMFAHRNYTIAQEDGTVCVRALSYWFLYDVARKRPARIRDEDVQWYEPSPALEWGQENRKIALSDTMTPREPVQILHYMIDNNGHVNNGWYIKIACEYLNPQKRIRELRVEYCNAAHFGDVFYPTVEENPQKALIALNNASGKPYAILEAIFDQES